MVCLDKACNQSETGRKTCAAQHAHLEKLEQFGPGLEARACEIAGPSEDLLQIPPPPSKLHVAVCHVALKLDAPHSFTS